MNVTFRLAALTAVIASAYAGASLLSACSSNGGSKDGGADSSTDSGKKDSGVKDSGGGGDAGDDSAAPTFDPLCTAPAQAASNGACITIDGTAFQCNPVTSTGCEDAGVGATCDLGDDGKGGSAFVCFPPPNDVALCGDCDNSNGPFCKPTMHCAPTASGFGCARFCCDDGDCTGGKCDLSILGGQAPGICVK